MHIYLYNSYVGSHAGFILGMVKPADGVFNITDSEIPDYIRACFEHALIKRVVGNINFAMGDSGPSCWLFLVKNLTYTCPRQGENFSWYLNIALETNDQRQFETLLKPSGTQDLAYMLAQCLEVDKSNKFGYRFKDSYLRSLLDSSFGPPLIPDNVADSALHGCFFEFQNRLPDEERSQRHYLE